MAFETIARGLCALGRACHARGSVIATSGNFSAVTHRDPLRLAITPRGADKGTLAPESILEIDEAGTVVRGEGRPSAEAALHLAVVRARSANAVAHSHSLWATLLGEEGQLVLEGYEMLKALAGVDTHTHREVLCVIENTQDWSAAAPLVEERLREQPAAHGFLIRRHGLYTWGADLVEAGRHLEALEFLLEAEGEAAMALVRVPAEGRSTSELAAVKDTLSELGIDYERWEPGRPLAEGAPAAEVLEAYAPEIDRLKAQGGYVTADVIDVTPQTPGLEAMLARFSREHWHDEDEVRFILRGSGIFHIRPREGLVHAIEVGPGDLLRVPRGTWHWFALCASRDIRAIRLFQDPSGWTPHYTETGAEKGFEPVCLGPAQVTGLSSS